MNTIVYVGMDVHKESYTLCCYCYDTDKVEYKQTIPSDYKLVLKYMESMRSRYEGDVSFVCGYEAGCLGYSLYHQLREHEVDCKILAPTTMAITNTRETKQSILLGAMNAEYKFIPVQNKNYESMYKFCIKDISQTVNVERNK